MKVYVEQGKEWKFIDIVDLVGPLAFRDVVVPIDVTNNSSDLIKIKLTAGFMLWDVDYVGMDYTTDENISVHYLNPSSAKTNDNKNVLNSISAKDDSYLAQRKTGDDVSITFQVPKNKTAGTQQDYIFYSRGYYNHVRDYKESPQLTTLLSFKMDGRFSKFSKEKLDEMNQLMEVAELSASAK
jgi:hypothetical protein